MGYPTQNIKSRLIALIVASLPALALAGEPSGISFFHRDWELACDNTLTCRAAGYQGDEEDLSVSVLLTRMAGPNEPVKGEVMIGQYGENPTLDSLPHDFVLSLRINGRSIGNISISKTSLVADLKPNQVAAILSALVRKSRIEFVTGDSIWRLSDQGAAAVLLKMDEFQGRIGTPGALAKKGTKDESAVRRPLKIPTVIVGPLQAPLPSDNTFIEKNKKALLAALRVTTTEDDCPLLAEEHQEGSGEFTVTRLTKSTMLVSTPCWQGAYNFGYGFWIINDSSPFRPILVTESGSGFSDGTISATQKGRGLGDCWSSDTWTWDGSRFVQTESSSTGMCKLLAPGGAWSLPTIVTNVQLPLPDKR